MFVPSVELLTQWVVDHGILWERIYGHPPRLVATAADEPDSPNDGRNLTYWLSLCDWFHMPHVQIFSSWSELLGMLRRDDLAAHLATVSRRMREFSARQRGELSRTWRPHF